MLTDDEGTKAIQTLLAVHNLSEPEEVSRKNWKTFTEDEKLKTEKAYNSVKKLLH